MQSVKTLIIYLQEMIKLITDLTEEISAAQISYWKKDEMRNALKALKKKIDDKDRERKAAVINEVVDLAKSILTENPNLPFFVHEFNGKFVLYSSLCHYTNIIPIGHPFEFCKWGPGKNSSNKSTNSVIVLPLWQKLPKTRQNETIIALVPINALIYTSDFFNGGY